ncbi:MAG: FAD-dependent oxidoreductase [Syntrophorhabdaceae bacterium]|nr:FAD-dependent oxidoreductase [Syntrophorhabdaceae bacterium]
MEKVDVVIVGGGLSGLSCAYRLAEKDLQVIVVERGDFPGSKNVTGGRLYIKPIEGIVGDMLDGAPFERKVVRERWTLMGEKNSVTVDFTGENLKENRHSFTVLRSTFDRWLSERVMEKGVFVIPRYRVDGLLQEEGKVVGIKAGGEEIYANVVVASDGVLSFMAEKAGLKPRMTPKGYAIGIKEVIELSEDRINERFNVGKEEGVAHLFIGDVTKGRFGGGFLYTNRNTVSLGVVVGIKAMMEAKPPIELHTLLDTFKARYEIEGFIKGGRTVEYGAHIIPEMGYKGISKLYHDGLIITGDAAGFALNMGITVRGMEFAIASGIMAGETILKAHSTGDYSVNTLSQYGEMLKSSFVIKDLYNFREMGDFLDRDEVFSLYPRSIPDMIEKVVWFDEGPKERIGATLWKAAKGSGLMGLNTLKLLLGLKKV